MKRTDVVHVGVDVRGRRVKGRLGSDRRVPVGRDSDDGDVGKRRAARQRRRPEKRTRKTDNQFKCVRLFRKNMATDVGHRSEGLMETSTQSRCCSRFLGLSTTDAAETGAGNEW